MDNCVAIGSGKELAKSVDAKYGITGLGEAKWVLEMLMVRIRPARAISISQEVFIDSILARFNLVDTSTISTPGAQLTAADCPLERTRRRRWAHALTGSSSGHSRSSHLAHSRTLRSPPARSPVLGTTPAAFIGKQPSASYGTSRVPRRDASSWVARPRRSSPSRSRLGKSTRRPALNRGIHRQDR